MVRGPAGEEVHTDAHGRFRAQFHWDREATGTDQDSRWLRSLQETATSMTLARTGWEVLVGYVGGDPERPVGLGRAMNGVSTPTYTLPQNRTKMAIRTPSVGGGDGHNEITFEDRAGEQAFSVRAERDLDIVVKNRRAEEIGNDEKRAVGQDLLRELAGKQTITIGADSTLRIAGDEKIGIQGDREKSVATTEKVDVKGNVTVKVAGDDLEKVATRRFTVAGSIEEPDWKKLGNDALRSLGATFLNTLAPGLGKAYTSAKSMQAKFETWPKKLDTFPDAVQAAAAAAVKETLGRTLGVETTKVKPAPPVDDKKPPADATPPAGAKPPGDKKEEKKEDPPETPLEHGLAKFDSTLHGTLDTMLPTKAELESLVPGSSWRPTDKTWDAAVDKVGKEAWSMIKKQLSVEAVINLCCKGGISRTAKGPMYRVVGACFITAAVLGIDQRAGYLYLETVGGLKLTVANKEITENVTGKLDVTVGGAVQRLSTGAMELSSGTSSKILVGGAARYKAARELSIFGDVIEVQVTTSLDVTGGNASFTFGPDTVKLTGKLSLTSGKAVTLSGGQKLQITG